MADLGEGARGPPLFWLEKEEMTEGRKAGWAGKLKGAPSLAKSLDPPLAMANQKNLLNLGLSLTSMCLYDYLRRISQFTGKRRHRKY